MTLSPCLHCTRKIHKRHRGLCLRCWRDPEIRQRYPLLFDPDGDRYLLAPPPHAATEAIPGSEAKIHVLEERAQRVEQLHHPDDYESTPDYAGLGLLLKEVLGVERCREILMGA